MEAYCARIRAAITAGSHRTLCAALDRGPTSGLPDAEEIERTLLEKFPVKPDGEIGDQPEGAWLDQNLPDRRHPTELTAAGLARWARAKRAQAPDAGGWCGQLLLHLHETDHAVTAALARCWSKDPALWTSTQAAALTWRTMRGACIPQPGRLPRPIAVASVARRAWSSHIARRLLPHAARYCASRGQFGLSGSAGHSAYCLAARTLFALGADILVDDKANSFHELHRSAILHGATVFTAALGAESAGTTTPLLRALLQRTFADGAHAMYRTTYRFAGGRQQTNHALCQGSPEASLLEALAYSQRPWANVSHGVRREFHDDGFTAILPDADIRELTRPPTTDGSRIAVKKDRCIGPRAAEAVGLSLSREATQSTLVAGIPLGDTMAGLDTWRERYRTRLRRIREIASYDLQIATQVMHYIGGPAGLAAHLLRALPPTKQMLSFWEGIDSEWIDLWLDLLRLDPITRETCRPSVAATATDPDGFRGALATPTADLRYAESLAEASELLQRILARAGIEMGREVWAALEIQEWAKGEGGWTADDLRKAATARAGLARAKIAARESDTRHRGPPNLLVTWAISEPPDPAPRVRLADAHVALRRLFALPLPGPDTAVDDPRDCARCGAAASSGGIGDGSAGPRSRVDRLGDHALSCARAKGALQRRHNEVAFAVRLCITEAGWDGSICGGPVFAGHGGRPADVWARRHPLHPAGQAIDVTVVSTTGRPPGSAAASAEEKKRKKYAADIAQSPGLGFAPFALDLRGGIGPSAWTEMQRWATATAAREDLALDRGQALQRISSRMAHALVTGITRQIREYEISQNSARQHDRQSCQTTSQEKKTESEKLHSAAHCAPDDGCLRLCRSVCAARRCDMRPATDARDNPIDHRW